MTTDEVEDGVRGVIAEVFGLDPDDVGADTSSQTVEAWDSLQHLTVVLALEEEFDIHLGDEETIAAVSIPAITGIVREHLGMLEPR